MHDVPDETIVQYAKSNHLVLVTRDFDFADIRSYQPSLISVSWCSTHRKNPIREPSPRTDIQPAVSRQRPLRGGYRQEDIGEWIDTPPAGT